MSTHPRTRPEFKLGMERQHMEGERLMSSNCTSTAADLQEDFPELCAMANFFDVVARRQTATKSPGILPAELYYQILDMVDYDTWRACSVVSPILRNYCLAKYRLDEKTRIVAGPFARLRSPYRGRLLSFDVQDMMTGEVVPMMLDAYQTKESEPGLRRWVELLGRGERTVIMSDVVMQFEPAGDMPVVDDGDDESWYAPLVYSVNDGEIGLEG
jgi:hypothetical protein